jgi:hypothetical protein
MSKLRRRDRVRVLECCVCGMQYSYDNESGSCVDCGGELRWETEEVYDRHFEMWMIQKEGKNANEETGPVQVRRGSREDQGRAWRVGHHSLYKMRRKLRRAHERMFRNKGMEDKEQEWQEV